MPLVTVVNLKQVCVLVWAEVAGAGTHLPSLTDIIMTLRDCCRDRQAGKIFKAIKYEL